MQYENKIIEEAVLILSPGYNFGYQQYLGRARGYDGPTA